MGITAAAIPIDPTVYRRRARQIRARFAGRPGAMHHALSGLARRSDRRPLRVIQRLPADPVVGAIEKGFADHISERITGGTFSYSDRMAAMQSAERIGISRLRANLIVSLALDALSDRGGATRGPARRSDKTIRSFPAIVCKVLAVEVALAAIVYLCLG